MRISEFSFFELNNIMIYSCLYVVLKCNNLLKIENMGQIYEEKSLQFHRGSEKVSSVFHLLEGMG